jgi:uncharacterized protein YodC (DUF2158 family)
MRDETPWKPGDLVQMKSGGPPMTVAGQDQLGRIICDWFVGTNQKNGAFNAAVLKKYEPPKPISIMRG